MDAYNDFSKDPDGFTVEFFKRYWEFFKRELLDAYNGFSRRPNIPKGVNVAFITHIPKITNPVLVKDFRPVSLI